MLPIKNLIADLIIYKKKLLANFGHGILQINHQSILSLYKTQKSYQNKLSIFAQKRNNYELRDMRVEDS